MKEQKENKKPVYCYQCAQKGHYGHVKWIIYLQAVFLKNCMFTLFNNTV